MKRILVLVAVVALVIGWIVRRDPRPNASPDSGRPPPTVSSPPEASTSVLAGPVEVTVYGTVRSPGKITLSRPSLAEALARTVPYILPDTKKVRVQRFQEGVLVKDSVVDATGIAQGTTADILLANGDHVFVPEKLL